MPSAYRKDLAFIHDAGFLTYADHASGVVVKTLRRAGIRRGLVVDLGCGSGATAARLSATGYDVLGVDLSPSMIALARKRVPRAVFRVTSWLDAEIPRCVAVTAIGEVLNYMLDRRNAGPTLAALFRRVHASLAPGGIFVFDVLLSGHVAGNGTRVGHREGDGWAVMVTVVEDRRRKTLARTITTFRRVGAHYRRDHEVHCQRLMSRNTIVALLRAAGFRVRALRRYGSLPLGRAHVGFVARKPVRARAS
jgi:SAM-dependent methyltransferase